MISQMENIEAYQTLDPLDELRLLKLAIYSSSNGITIADARKPDLPLIFVNPAFERLTGYPGGESIGRNCRFLHCHDRDQEGLDRVRLAIREAKDCLVVIRNYRKNGSLFWNELYLSPILDNEGSPTHFLGVQNDVTSRVQLEQTRDQFFQIASHDLKSPLNAILTTTAIVSELAKPGQVMTEDLSHILSNIHTRGKEMQGIIEDYLDFQAIEDRKISVRLQAVDLGQLIEECVSRNKDYAHRKGISITLEMGPEKILVKADPSKCLQVLQNLLGNAIKFSPSSTEIRIRLNAEGDRVRAEVCDQGPGLKDADLDRIFSKYARLSNRPTSGEKSSGLGLYISKKLVELHSGKLGVYNNPNQGCTFWLRLPRA